MLLRRWCMRPSGEGSFALERDGHEALSKYVANVRTSPTHPMTIAVTALSDNSGHPLSHCK